METLTNAKLLRIFLGEMDKIGHKPLYEAIVLKARENKMSGATVLRGILSFGANSLVHSAKLFELSPDMPIIVEIVDSEEKMNAFIPMVEEMFEISQSGGLITMEKAEVIRYRPTKKKE
jgi:PII-like signaling protein